MRKFGFFGVEPIPAGLQPPGPVAQRARILGEQVLVGAGSGSCLEHVYVTLDGLDPRCNTLTDFFLPLRPRVGARSPACRVVSDR